MRRATVYLLNLLPLPQHVDIAGISYGELSRK